MAKKSKASRQRGRNTAPLDTILKAKEYQVPPPVKEWKFAKEIGRRWAFDFAWPDVKLAVEIEGGVWIGGRHTSGAGFTKDMEKYNAAALMGWTLLRYTPTAIKYDEISAAYKIKQGGRNAALK
ncbi:MAG: hypothetical protein WC505_07280 [Patescibacteria group bacterium]